MVIDFHYFNGGGGSGSGVTPAQVQAQIDSALTVYTPTSGFSTINGSAITDGSALIIDAGAGSESVVELTQAQYDALSAYAPDTTYIITDAVAINMDDYATTAETSALSADIATISGSMATKATVTANTTRQFPKWNAEGIITGTTGSVIYEKSLNVNGSNQSVLRNNNMDFGPIYGPTTAGSAGQPVLSNGSGAPVWGAYKFAFLTQTAYDALTTKDSTTIYFITGD